MGKYFADVHASAVSQLFGLPHGLADTDEAATCRQRPQTYENLLALADALCWQLRFREAIAVLTQAIALSPERMEAYRKRGPKLLDTLQFEKAMDDYVRCEQADGVSVESRYRIGMAHYMLGRYESAAAAFSDSLDIVPHDSDMYIADIYWLVLSCLRAGKAEAAGEILRTHYRPDVYTGHHTAYGKAMYAAAGYGTAEALLQELYREPDDLQYAMAAYGAAVLLDAHGKTQQAAAVRKQILARDGFWFCFSYLAACRDETQSK